MESEFNLTQSEWAEGYVKENEMTQARLAVCIMKANGIDTDLKDVMEHTTTEMVDNFIKAYVQVSTGRTTEEILSEASEEDEEGK